MEMESINALRDLGYTFNTVGELRKIGSTGDPTDEPFNFNISENAEECQANYEKIGNAVTNYIYNLLEKDEKLIRLKVPEDSTPHSGTFIFASKDYDKNDKLMILIQGIGAVRAGQWSRALIINNSMEIGSQIPYIKRALNKGFGIMVLNPNDNYSADGKSIKHSGTPEEHGLYVWNKYVSKCKAQNIVIVAHSYGGNITLKIAEKMKKDFENRVKAIAFTDSVHGFCNPKVMEFLRKVTKNWMSSLDPLDTPVHTPEYDVPRLSAGSKQHEMTSHSSIDSVFAFIDEKLTNK